MGRAARAWVLDHYVNEQVLGTTAHYYQSLMDQNLSSKGYAQPVSSGSALNPIY